MLKKLMISAFTALAITATAGNAAAQTVAQCDAYARDYANWWTGNPYGAALAGGAIGAIFGAVIGQALFNRPGIGAAVGGAAGAGAGAAIAGPEWQAAYNQAYNACLAQTPLPYPGAVNYNWNGGRYPTSDPRWFQYCQATYGQYWNPWTGYYTASNGLQYPCVVP